MEKYAEETKPMGMLAVSAGEGLSAIFKDLSSVTDIINKLSSFSFKNSLSVS